MFHIVHIVHASSASPSSIHYSYFFHHLSLSHTHKTPNGLKALVVAVTKKLVVAAKLPKQNHWQSLSTLDMGFIYAGNELQFLLLFQEAHG